jgi:hypothetical protein
VPVAISVTGVRLAEPEPDGVFGAFFGAGIAATSRVDESRK